MKIRRVVTGHDADGKAVFVSDDEVEPLTFSRVPGMAFHRLWGADEPPAYPDDGARPQEKTFFPEVGGFRMVVMTRPPPGTPMPEGADLERHQAEVDEKLPGISDWGEPDEPGMHTTNTIDMEIVLSGEITLELDDGVEKVVRAGETIIQNGTRHRWHNRGTGPAVLLAFVVGARREDRHPEGR